MRSKQEDKSFSIRRSTILEEIDLDVVVNAIRKNVKFISLFGLISAFMSAYVALSTGRTWQGEFQIVLSLRDDAPKEMNAELGNWGISRMPGKLKTDVEILKSPAVLMDIFNFIKGEKAKQNKSIEKVRFSDWKDSIQVSMKEGTSVLTVKYQDSDKELIIPVLNKVSKAYQEYSGRRRKRAIELGLTYFQEQIPIYKDKSAKSFKKAQEFGLENQLYYLDVPTAAIDNLNTINTEQIRIQSKKTINDIELKLAQISLISEDSDDFEYIISTIPELSTLTEKLRAIQSEIAKYSVIYTPKDKTIKDLQREKKFYIKLMKRQAIGLMQAKKGKAQDEFNQSFRPKEVIIKYRQLLSEFVKDRNTYTVLENQYRDLLLEKSKIQDPWQLITKPTLLPYPVAPRRKRMVLIGILLGISGASALAILSEKSKNIIYSIHDFDSLTDFPLLEKLSLYNKTAWKDSLSLLKSGLLKNLDQGNLDQSLSLIYIGEFKDTDINQLNKDVKEIFHIERLISTNNLLEAIQSEHIILVAGIGVTTKSDLYSINNKLLHQNNSVVGLLVLSDCNSKNGFYELSRSKFSNFRI